MLNRLYLAGACVLTLLLYIAAFPPVDFFPGGFVFALPLLLVALRGYSRRSWALACVATGWLAWAVLLVWLRHVYEPWGTVGLVLLSLALMPFLSGWLYVAGRLFAKAAFASLPRRLLIYLGLSGMWVVLEWARTWVLTGFPWLPLAASQWTQPAMLQVAAFTGGYGVSFMLVFFNFALAQAVVEFFKPKLLGEEPKPLSFTSFVPKCRECYIAVIFVTGSLTLYLQSLGREATRERLFEVAVVQPNFPALVEYDAERAQAQSAQLAQMTIEACSDGEQPPDFVLWHESATPYPIRTYYDNKMTEWMQALVNEIRAPILMGNLVHVKIDRPAEEITWLQSPEDGGPVVQPDGTVKVSEWTNGMFVFTPDGGLLETHYAKRRLVPFGEYTPLYDYIGWLGKVVPYSGNTVPGEQAVLLPVEIEGKTLLAGSLICYEDIFPELGREVASAGADFLVVVTNDSWYGEEGGAWQHAAHSVLRAVETRRPLIRCGNNGWSGWMDEWGNIRASLTDAEGCIYTTGWERYEVTRDGRFAAGQSFYTRTGDWLVAFSGGLVVLMIITLRRKPGVKSTSDDAAG